MKTVKAKIIVLIIIVAMIPTLICGGLCLMHAGKQMNVEEEQKVIQMAKQTKSTMNEVIRQMTRPVDTLTEYAVSQLDDLNAFQENPAYEKKYTEKLKPIIKKIANDTRGALTCFIRYNPDYTNPKSGLYYERASKYDEFSYKHPEDFSQYKSTDTDHVGWYYIPVANGEPTWMDAYFAEEKNTYVVPYIEPIKVNGQVIGVLGMEFDLKELSRFVEDSNLGKDGYAFLTDSKDFILVHQSVKFGTPLLNAASGLNYLDKMLSTNSRQGELISYTNQGAKIAVYYNLDNGMKLIQTAKEPYLHRFTRTLMIIVAACVLSTFAAALVVGWWQSISIAQPIEKLTDEFKAIAKLDLSHTDMEKRFVLSRDETGIMAREMINMNDKLRYIVRQMNYAKDNMYSSIAQLNRQMKNMDLACTDSVAAAKETDNSIHKVEEQVTKLDKQTVQFKESAEKLHTLFFIHKEEEKKCGELMNLAHESGQNTRTLCEKMQMIIKEVTQQTKQMRRITDLTKQIKESTSRTNLLALHAAVEANKKGEKKNVLLGAGNEIGILAVKEQQNVKEIEKLTENAYAAVCSMRDCMQEVSAFLKARIIKDYEMLEQVNRSRQNQRQTEEEELQEAGVVAQELADGMKQMLDMLAQVGTSVSQTKGGIDVFVERGILLTNGIKEVNGLLSTSRRSVENLAKVVQEFQL